ncbi:phosphatase 2C-like domain-containing protein [Dunaliella salina]|uniref:Phosphatase 2C-like domain-containing protein n=1 Tax=Dunaliella salina TaxID=3046 RepID=A0ABQ7H2L5_DUNSA|nr:phosphatase 2C-like domain-containing protein [Dunaliella salina]|eukprot:KAF5841103.1 phosphatase 2C-like domain-containing protein [Dunaliella salina]
MSLATASGRFSCLHAHQGIVATQPVTPVHPLARRRKCSGVPASTLTVSPSPVRVPGFHEYGFKAEQGLRGNMEDELHAQWNEAQDYLFLGCYDGHGGTASAQWLKAHLHQTVAEKLKEGVSTGEDPGSTLASAFKHADNLLLEHLQGDDELEQTGSTATVAIVRQDGVSVANVGDSQACIMRRDRSLVQLTTPHRVYGPKSQAIADEVARVKAAGGWVYDGRVCNILAVSRAFGDWEMKGIGLAKLLSAGVERGYWPQEFADKQNFTSDPVIVNPATASADLTEEDEFLVVSTDGLWDVMQPREAMLYARKELLRGKSAQEVAESLVEVALKRYSSDNISTLVVDFKDPEYWAGQNKKPRGFWSFLS